MNLKSTLIACTAGLLLSGLSLSAQAWQTVGDGDLEVEVVADGGDAFRQVPLRRSHGERAYLVARQGENYAIRVRNRGPHRLGLVIAADGRNILSGRKSHLKANERMYVLGPWQSATYRGWRTGKNHINRFYFTDAGDSYADAWKDRTALGVIAVAVYRQRHREAIQETAPGYRKALPKRRSLHRDQVGTGFGNGEYSASRVVAFQPRRRPEGRLFLKYAWRETLCQQGVIRCQREQNRFWPERLDALADYAPYPPGRRCR